MNILAFGVTGFVGAHLVPHLVERGHAVTVAARSGRARFGVDVPVITADPTQPGPWQEQVAGFDAIINLSGAPVLTRWNERGRAAIFDSRILSTRHIVAAMRPEGGQTLLCANAIGYFGNAGDQLCADDAPKGDGFLADVAAAWQDEALHAQATGHRVLLPRVSVVLGPGGALAKMLLPFSLGLGGRIGSGRQWFSWIHRDDLVRLMSFLLETPQASGAFNACAPYPVSNAEFTRALGQALHRPTPFPVPGPLLRLVLGEAASMLLDGQRCRPERLLDAGFVFTYPRIQAALANVIPAMKDKR